MNHRKQASVYFGVLMFFIFASFLLFFVHERIALRASEIEHRSASFQLDKWMFSDFVKFGDQLSLHIYDTLDRQLEQTGAEIPQNRLQSRPCVFSWKFDLGYILASLKYLSSDGDFSEAYATARYRLFSPLCYLQPPVFSETEHPDRESEALLLLDRIMSEGMPETMNAEKIYLEAPGEYTLTEEGMNLVLYTPKGDRREIPYSSFYYIDGTIGGILLKMDRAMFTRRKSMAIYVQGDVHVKGDMRLYGILAIRNGNLRVDGSLEIDGLALIDGRTAFRNTRPKSVMPVTLFTKFQALRDFELVNFSR